VTATATAVALRGLTKRYGDSTVVDGIDLEVPAGSLTALLGPSGCGKTTTLRMVAGLLPVDAGDVLFGGESVLHLAAERRPVAMVFQKPLLFPHLSVGDNVAFGLRMQKVDKPARRERVARMLSLVRLSELADRQVGEMSGGQEQRVALARALVTEPQVLLLDEPFSQLDAGLRVEMRELVRGLQQQLEVTTLFVTHDQEEAVGLSDQVALVLDGRVEQLGAPREFYEAPRTLRAARFFGGRNELPGHVAGGLFTFAAGVVATSLPDGPAVAVVRQEAVRLAAGGTGAAAPGSVPATLVESRFLGTHTAVVLGLSDGTLLHAVARDLPGLAPGGRLAVEVPTYACTVLPLTRG